MSAENKKQFFIPKNFAHGFVVLSDTAEFCIQMLQISIIRMMRAVLHCNDPDIGVEWPIPEGMELILSDKDQKWGSFVRNRELQTGVKNDRKKKNVCLEKVYKNRKLVFNLWQKMISKQNMRVLILEQYGRSYSRS